LTKANDPIHVAHLFPFCLRHESSFSGRDSIWGVLLYFWEAEKVTAWYNAVFDQGTETVSNMLCFAPTIHAYHSRALFALEPTQLSEDHTCQKVKFHWLYAQKHTRRAELTRSPEIPEPSSTGTGPRELRLFDVPTGRPLCSGDEVSITTPDPDRLALPSPKILEMQFILQQVAALKGGGELLDYEGEDCEGVLADGPEVEEWILSTPTPSTPPTNSTPPSGTVSAQNPPDPGQRGSCGDEHNAP
jgi:hypothetical protein